MLIREKRSSPGLSTEPIPKFAPPPLSATNKSRLVSLLALIMEELARTT